MFPRLVQIASIAAAVGILGAGPCLAFSVSEAHANRDGSRLADPDEILEQAIPLASGVMNYQERPSLRGSRTIIVYDLSAPTLKTKPGATTDQLHRHSDDPRVNPFAGLNVDEVADR